MIKIKIYLFNSKIEATFIQKILCTYSILPINILVIKLGDRLDKNFQQQS